MGLAQRSGAACDDNAQALISRHARRYALCSARSAAFSLPLAALPLLSAASTLPGHAHGITANSAREATLWLYAPTADNATWAGWYAALGAHAGNVTGVAPCSYSMDSSGLFTTQFATQADYWMASNWTLEMTRLGLDAEPLLAASGSGMNVAISNITVGSTFIAATVAEAQRLGLSGYNLQLEEAGSPALQVQWETFLGEWLDALDAAGGLRLSIIIGGYCHARDWMYMDCGNYKLLAENATAPHANLRVISEATYEGDPTDWLEFAGGLVTGLGPQLAAFGMEYNAPLLDPATGCLARAAALGVTALYAWVNVPAVNDTAAWDAFGWWLAGPAATPHFLPA
jgi:hypothetical protein